MDHSQFDRLARAYGAARSRRAVTTLLGALLVVPLSGHNPVAAKKKKRKVTLCLNGETITVPKKKKSTFLRQGATPGACAGGNTGCPTGTKQCNGQCIDVGLCCTTSDCDPCLRQICVDGACACPTGMAPDADGVCSIFTSCVSVGPQPVTNPAYCCSGRGASNGTGLFYCVPGNETCAFDVDCLHGQHCVGNLCAQAYINTVGDQCADRAFDICSVRTQCTTGRCEDNLCKTCASDAECRREPDPGHTCFCEDTVCLRRSRIDPVNSCSECPANTAYCKPVSNKFVCYPLCGGR